MLSLTARSCFSCFRVGKDKSKDFIVLGQPMTPIMSLCSFRPGKIPPMLIMKPAHIQPQSVLEALAHALLVMAEALWNHFVVP